jgi:murein DD-endopeptidase MepM/ murein hydrolase activator NlpD
MEFLGRLVIFAKKDKSKFGKGVRANGKRNHQGVDIQAEVGTETVAVKNGKIAKVYVSKSFGKTVMLQFKDSKGKTLYAQYSHLSEIKVKEGDEVKEGDVIGKTGKTGNAKDLTKDEEHLHFGISTTKTPQKGLSTYIDPEEFMTIETPEEPDNSSQNSRTNNSDTKKNDQDLSEKKRGE